MSKITSIKNNVIVTHHSAQRLVERFMAWIKENRPTLLNWQKGDNLQDFYIVFKKIIAQSVENNALKNNTAKMVSYYEKFGYHSDFICLENTALEMLLLFKQEKTESKNIYKLLTVLPTKFLIKYKNNLIHIKAPKEERKTINVLKEYNQLQKQLGKDTFKFVQQDRLIELTSSLRKETIKKELPKKKLALTYSYFMEQGFLAPTSELHICLDMLERNQHINGASILSLKQSLKLGKNKNVFHLTLKDETYTIFKRKCKSGCFYCIIEKNNSSIETIQAWLTRTHWDKN